MKSRLLILMLAVAVNGLPACSRKPDSSQRLQESAVDRAYKVDSPKKSDADPGRHSGSASVGHSSPDAETVTDAGKEIASETRLETSMNIEPGVPRIWQNGPSAKEKARRNTIRHRQPVVTDQVGRQGVGQFGAPILDTTGLRRIDSL